MHPYYGFVGRPSLVLDFSATCKEKRCKWFLNKQGFISDFPYPYGKKNAEEVTVGLFGGSVSAGMYFSAQEIFQERIKKYSEGKCKTVTVLTHGFGGYKQPQQQIIMSELASRGHELDFVLNIDGFNEVAHAYGNEITGKIDNSMPYHGFLNPVVSSLDAGLTIEQIDAIGNVRRLRQLVVNAARSFKEKKWGNRRIRYLIRYRNYNASLAEAQARLEQTMAGKNKNAAKDFFVKPADQANDVQAIMATETKSWAKSVRQMQAITNESKTFFMSVVQPNQYYGNRKFTAQQKTIALADGPFRDAVIAGYPHLAKKVPDLKARGVNIFAPTEIFDNVEENMYSDSCCHYTPAGYKILANFIVDRMFEDIARAKKDGKLNVPACLK